MDIREAVRSIVFGRRGHQDTPAKSEMDVRAAILSLASDNQKAKDFSRQMLLASKQGTNPSVIIGNKRITLVRTARLDLPMKP